MCLCMSVYVCVFVCMCVKCINNWIGNVESHETWNTLTPATTAALLPLNMWAKAKPEVGDLDEVHCHGTVGPMHYICITLYWISLYCGKVNFLEIKQLNNHMECLVLVNLENELLQIQYKSNAAIKQYSSLVCSTACIDLIQPEISNGQ